jgi:hypothetical protein
MNTLKALIIALAWVTIFALPSAAQHPHQKEAVRLGGVPAASQTGHDFLGYKPSTIERRMQRPIATAIFWPGVRARRLYG